MWIAVAAVAAALLVLVVLNLAPAEKKIRHRISHLYTIDDPQFTRTMGTLLGPAIVPGNAVVGLMNGDEIFPAMLDAIRAAQRTITFETYIYWSGETGRAFAVALCERAQAGVKVHLLLDWVGTAKMDAALLDEMRGAGVEIERFHPLRWYTLGRINNRTHRKLLVVDGWVGFTGGVGVADNWLGHGQDPEHWRDSHYRLTGPAVAQMQAAFLDHWIATRSLVLHGEEYFPPLEPTGAARAQVFVSGDDDGSESTRLMYLLSIASATRRIRIASAYFVPDDLAIETLVAARERGVEVEVIVPGKHTDTALVRRASRARWGRLLEAGVKIYEFEPTMYHCKVMIIDDCWTSVGSTNFDSRSFRLNDEANLNVYDGDFAQDQGRRFTEDRERSREVTLEAWRCRPWTDKMTEHAAALLRSQL